MDQQLGLVGKCLVYTGYFGQLSVQGQSESIQCVSISKTVGDRAKQTKIWPLGKVDLDVYSVL